MRNIILLALSIFVFTLATAGEYANLLLEYKVEASAEVNSENSKSLPEKAELSVDIFNSVLQVSHLVFHSDLIFEFNLCEVNETKAHSVFDTASNFTNYFKTLFHFIISPNAP